MVSPLVGLIWERVRETLELDEVLARLVGNQGTPLLVVAHPDDDVLGAGALLARIPRVQVVYVTDGAPPDGQDARAHGFTSVRDYAAARRREAAAALELAGVDPRQTVWLDVPDKAAVFALDGIARAVRELIVAASAPVLLTHPYEGGHPDHDAVAFAAHAAVTTLARAARHPPPLVEFMGYHAGPQGGREVSFLEHAGTPAMTFQLSPAEARLKSEMLARHATQAAVLADFPRDREAFRLAPAYDFTAPPHAGPLLYEQAGFGAAWGIDGARWRSEAAVGRRRLGLP